MRLAGGAGRLIRASVGAVVLAGSAVPLTGCSVSLPSSVACSDAPPVTLSAIQTRLSVAGTLRNGRTVPTTGAMRIVSAELHRRGDQLHDKGDILSWAELAPGRFEAVDAKARQDSSWPAAPFDVRHVGVVTSRGCVEALRGTIPCDTNSNGLLGGGVTNVNSNCKGGRQ